MDYYKNIEMDNSLTYQERLRTIGAIKRLFESGESGFIYPFRYVWFAEVDEVSSAKVLFSVPKKFHKKANKRNTLRRRTKEAYRLNKSKIKSEDKNLSLEVAIIYSVKESVSYKKIDHAIKNILEQIAAKS